MNPFEILLGQVPEALYFALFIILSKNITTKRFTFIVSAILEYILLMYAFPYNIWSHILYFIALYLILKLFYNDKCQITDIFTLGIASLILMICSFVVFTIFGPNMLISNIINKIVLFGILFILRNKLSLIQNIYKKLWNRNDNVRKKIKSTTFRSLNVVIFNFMFYIINIGMVCAIVW